MKWKTCMMATVALFLVLVLVPTASAQATDTIYPKDVEFSTGSCWQLGNNVGKCDDSIMLDDGFSPGVPIRLGWATFDLTGTFGGGSLPTFVSAELVFFVVKDVATPYARVNYVPWVDPSYQGAASLIDSLESNAKTQVFSADVDTGNGIREYDTPLYPSQWKTPPSTTAWTFSWLAPTQPAEGEANAQVDGYYVPQGEERRIPTKPFLVLVTQ